MSNSNGEPLNQDEIEAKAVELKIPYTEAERMIESAEDCWF